MVRRLAQATIAAGTGNRITVATVESVLGEAVGSRNRIGRRIVGLASGGPERAGKQAPPFHGCCDDPQICDRPLEPVTDQRTGMVGPASAAPVLRWLDGA